ncbi:hypothetical protein Scani_80360 [Streptomyces caniferus]|uniref:Uncharacterized protein n=1 Tax=Streptomyces caniferus TaxID=285557 RepID=A0A640SL14_9ACTN|nr:hypothetical protein Scani_80360 [Streptomyces caniferus]
MRPAGPRQRHRPRAELRGQLPLHLTGAVPEPLCQSADPLPVDHAVVDEPHGPAHQVGAHIPLGRPRHGAGRHRRQARNPADCAAAADGKNRTFTRLGVTAGQPGRQ